jgi:hypothetical protein
MTLYRVQVAMGVKCPEDGRIKVTESELRSIRKRKQELARATSEAW